jgi:hypothetical protein
MTVVVLGKKRQEGRILVEEARTASWEGKPLKGGTPGALAG